jgi:hypothetical protein
MFWALLTYLNKCSDEAHDHMQTVMMLGCHGNSEFLHEFSKTV